MNHECMTIAPSFLVMPMAIFLLVLHTLRCAFLISSIEHAWFCVFTNARKIDWTEDGSGLAGLREYCLHYLRILHHYCTR